MTPWQFTRGMRSLGRLRHVAQVLTRNGFGHIVERLRLARFVPVWILRRKVRVPVDDSLASLGKRITRVCNELGPTFIKFGQMLSTRPDILPPEILRELRGLQDHVEPFDTTVARKLIEEELSQPVDRIFEHFDDEPIASGSIGQVYRARIRGGADVVVKVRRPEAVDIVRMDLQLLTWLADGLESYVPELRIYQPRAIVQEFEQLIERELDFVYESSAISSFAEFYWDNPHIDIPTVHWNLTTSGVVVFNEIKGVPLSELLASEPLGEEYDPRLIAHRLLEAYLDQVFELGQYHADPHPGNIFIDAPARIGLIDFGQTGTISDDTVSQLVIMVYAAVRREVDLVVDALSELDALGPNTSKRDLQRSLRVLFDKYYGLPLKRFDVSALLHEFTAVVRRHDVIVPREGIVLIKAVGMVIGVATDLDPELDVLKLLTPRIKAVMRERISPRRLTKNAAVGGWHLMNIVRRLPMDLREGLRRISSGQWQLNVKHENIDRLATELDRSSNRLAFSVIIAAIIVGSSMIITVDHEAKLLGFIRIQSVGVFGYVIAGILGLGLTWAIIRSGRLH